MIATVCFALAIVHTFSASLLRKWAARFSAGTVAENALHLLGEVEVVFGLWAGIYLLALSLTEGPAQSLAYLEQL